MMLLLFTKGNDEFVVLASDNEVDEAISSAEEDGYTLQDEYETEDHDFTIWPADRRLRPA